MMSSTFLAAPPSSPRLLDQVRERIRGKHYSLRTEQAYLGWIKRYIFFHDKRHPRDMGKAEVGAFLGALAVERNVSAATQTQALSALLFLYREVLGIELPGIWRTAMVGCGCLMRCQSSTRARGGESARCGVVSVSWDVRVGE